VVLVFVADLARMENASSESREAMANLDVGYISQNAYLYCASEGLATGARVSLNQKALGEKLRLRREQLIILAHSVGYPTPDTK
jgi:nitroreductase